MYDVLITKGEVLKLRCLCIMCGSLKEKFKVALSIYHVRIPKGEVLKLRCLYIMRGSRKEKF